GVDREGVDGHVLARLGRGLARADAGTVAEAGGTSAPAGPATVAVHDDPDVAGDLRVHGCRKRTDRAPGRLQRRQGSRVYPGCDTRRSRTPSVAGGMLLRQSERYTGRRAAPAAKPHAR